MMVGIPHGGTVDERHRARITTARRAADAADLRYLLDALALWPQQDGEARSAYDGLIVWGADVHARRRQR